MAGIMADHNVEGHFVVWLRLWTSEAWRAVWESLQLEVESFERLGISPDTSDHDLWQLCQQREIILLTANRNDEGPDSLEATMRALHVPSSVPILTSADPERVLASRDYAERVAIQVLEYLLDLDHFRGIGRLFVP
ncbi:MAG: hypothetical protein AB7N91_15315 [Candidatus Tectimicrobiota bacterium]